MMKFLAIFMFLIVTSLSFVPCCTPIAKDDSNNTSEITKDCCEKETCKDSKASSKPSKDKSNCNSCSPFFSCGSCSGFTAKIDFLKIADFAFPVSISYNSFELQIHSDFLETKWKPPKIS